MGDISILLADDRPTVRNRLRRLLADQSGLRVVAEVASGPEAVVVAERLGPDVAVMDLQLARASGSDITGRLAQVSPQTRVLMLSLDWDDGALLDALEAGAWGCVRKEASSGELREAIDAVHGGQVGMTALMTSKLVAEYCRRSSESRLPRTRTLTPRDQRFLASLCEGWSNREIAHRLSLSEQTVKNTLTLLYQKMQVENRAEAAAFYRRLAASALAS